MADKPFPITIGIAVGISAGLFFFIIGVIGSYGTFAHDFINTVGSLFSGYHPSWTGAFIGMVWAYLYSFIFTTAATWFYNLLT